MLGAQVARNLSEMSDRNQTWVRMEPWRPLEKLPLVRLVDWRIRPTAPGGLRYSERGAPAAIALQTRAGTKTGRHDWSSRLGRSMQPRDAGPES